VKNLKKHLRILFISADKYPPFRVDVSVLFGKEIISRGHCIDWILLSEEECNKSYNTQWNGSRVWVGKTNNGSSRLARTIKHLYSIKNDLILFRLLRQSSYDFIQVKDKFISAIFAIIAAKRHQTKFVYWLSFPFPEAASYAAKTGTARYPIFYLIKGFVLKILLYKIILPKAYHVFVQSDQMKQDLIEKGVPPIKMTTVPMGVSLEAVPYAEDKLKGKKNTILYLGTLTKERRIEFLVEVLAVVKNSIPDALLYLVGEGNDPKDREIIIAKAKELDVLDSIIITGFVPRHEAMNYVKNAGVCVSPFIPSPILKSTSPTKLVEYMAMGRPVVANDHPEQRAVIKESGAGFCVPYDVNSFTDAIKFLLKNPDKASEMGKKGRIYIETKRSYTKIADKLENQYLKLCHSI
jgi:glycosyltransferase involved in cell wall biosynthesis